MGLNRTMKIVLLALLVVGEIALFSYVWGQTKTRASVGFLVKNGTAYILGWRETGNLEEKSYPNLAAALAAAGGELGLKFRRGGQEGTELENIWLDERPHGFIVFWKFEGSSFLNQMTFASRPDALYFAQAFRKGAYTPSPFGHAILFVPQK